MRLQGHWFCKIDFFYFWMLWTPQTKFAPTPLLLWRWHRSQKQTSPKQIKPQLSSWLDSTVGQISLTFSEATWFFKFIICLGFLPFCNWQNSWREKQAVWEKERGWHAAKGNRLGANPRSPQLLTSPQSNMDSTSYFENDAWTGALKDFFHTLESWVAQQVDISTAPTSETHIWSVHFHLLGYDTADIYMCRDDLYLWMNQALFSARGLVWVKRLPWTFDVVWLIPCCHEIKSHYFCQWWGYLTEQEVIMIAVTIWNIAFILLVSEITHCCVAVTS